MPNALTLGDPADIARQQAAHLSSDRDQYLHGPLRRLLGDSPFVDRDSLLAGLEAFHNERMSKVPSTATYPEAQPWIDHLIAVERALKQQGGLTAQEVALHLSLGDYVRWRGYRHAAKAQGLSTEKCRVVHIAETDRGEMHIKNVDDPATYWKPTQRDRNAKPGKFKWQKVGLDGVGSGLHIDDEPAEIFPLNAREMVFHYVDDVPGAVEFLTRYKLFWGGQNVVLFDDQKRSCAVEKTSHNHMQVFPSRDGVSHCSGMACRDPQSEQGVYQRERRQEYLERFDQAADGPDQTFWDACDRAERMLGDHLAAAGPKPRFDEIVTLFTTPWPKGLNKTGAKMHPDQTSAVEYTLITNLTLIDEKTSMTWQRDKDLNYPAEPCVTVYA